MKGEICQIAFAVVFVPAMILGWLNVMDALRLRRLRRTYRNMSSQDRRRILDRIDEVGRKNVACTVLVASNPAGDDYPSATDSHFCGVPYAEAGDVWPRLCDGRPEPADFLIQILIGQTLPPPWPGRLIVVFNQLDADQIVRCYASTSAARAVTLPGGSQGQTPWNLVPVRIPHPTADESTNPGTSRIRGELLSYDPVVLLEIVPGLLDLLRPHTNRPADLLAMILAPNYRGAHGFELSDIVQLGGQPVWLSKHLDGVNCDQCGRSMRFLFQFGDLNDGILLGNSGVCYVFGCDDHPDQPLAIVQM